MSKSAPAFPVRSIRSAACRQEDEIGVKLTSRKPASGGASGGAISPAASISSMEGISRSRSAVLRKTSRHARRTAPRRTGAGSRRGTR